MKKLVCLALVLLMVLGCVACAPVAAPTAEKPAASVSAAASSSAAAPSKAAESSAAAPSTQKMVEKYPKIAYGPTAGKNDTDYKFGFSFGGVASFADPIPVMANLAAKELGIPEVTVMTPQNWEQNEQNQMLDGLISAGCTSIFMMPSEATAANEQINKMVDGGVAITCVGCPPNGDSTKATLTLCTDTYQAAFDGAMACIQAMGGKGNVVALSGALNDSNTKKRFQGVQDACDKNPGVKLIQKIGDIENPEASMTAINNLLTARADEINGIVATTYETGTSLAKIMLQDTAGAYSKITTVGTDTDPKVIEAILGGKMLGTMTQSPWAMGYVSMYTLKMLKDGWTLKADAPKVFNTGASLVKKDQAANYEELAKTAAIKILDTWCDNFNPPS